MPNAHPSLLASQISYGFYRVVQSGFELKTAHDYLATKQPRILTSAGIRRIVC